MWTEVMICLANAQLLLWSPVICSELTVVAMQLAGDNWKYSYLFAGDLRKTNFSSMWMLVNRCTISD
jgi:hypothetical protein